MKILPKKREGKICVGLYHKEFRCKCRYKECLATIIAESLIRAYSRFRNEVDTPLDVNSGYRCPRHNKGEGGTPLSRHQTGEAIDIEYDQALEARYSVDEVIDLLRSSGFNFVKWYPGLRIFHADTRPIY